MANATPPPRRHDLDALRAFAMLLGIGLHAGLSFAPFPWPVQDSQQNPIFYLFFAAVHGFRMPLFFLLSGFFTAMLWRRRGLGATVSHRARRILLPLIGALATPVPLFNVTVEWVVARQAAPPPPATEEVTSVADAARRGVTPALERLLGEGGDPNDRDETTGVPALSWAAMHDDVAACELLLDAGAEVNGRNPDQATALHGAAFLGRAVVVRLLLERGADPTLTSSRGDTPIEAAAVDWSVVKMVAPMLQVPLPEPDEGRAGQALARDLLAKAAAGGDAPADEAKNEPDDGEAESNGFLAELRTSYFAWLHGPTLSIPRFWTAAPDDRFHLVDEPVLQHLRFLGFLCWLTPLFACYASLLAWSGVDRLPAWLGRSWLRWLWIVPATLAWQTFMHVGQEGFGPDTSAGLVPAPHVLGYYAVFYFFGAIYYDSDDSQGRVGHWWALKLPLAVVVAVVGGAGEAIPLWSDLGEALYAWLMSFGLMGFFRWALRRESSAVRYVSDSSYWLYLSHLPLLLYGQWLIRSWEAPSVLKFTVLCVVVSALLLVSYEYLIRYTAIGRMLNGPRQRPGTASRAAPAEPLATTGISTP